MKNKQRRYEAGKVFLDLSKYLATTVAISGLVVSFKETINWLPVILGTAVSAGLFIIGIKTIPLDKED